MKVHPGRGESSATKNCELLINMESESSLLRESLICKYVYVFIITIFQLHLYYNAKYNQLNINSYIDFKLKLVIC